SKCNRREDEGRIRIVDAKYGWAGEVALLGKPSDPGNLKVTCEVVDQSCMAAQVESSPNCSALDFGSLNMGESCQIDVRFENTAGIDAAPVSIQALQLWVAGHETGERIAGDAVGIEGFQNQKFEIPPGQGHSVTLAFTPNATGTWETTADENLGLHIYTDSSDIKPAWRIDVKAASAAPQLEVYPSSLQWQKATVGLRSTSMVTVSNSGNADLALKRLYSRDENAHLDIPNVRDITIAPGESYTLEVAYLGSEDIFTTELLLETSDPHQSVFAIPVSIEPTPKLCLEPGSMLEIDDEVGDIRLTNCGDGVLTISDLKLEHSDASSAHNSIDDFIIEGCPQNNCQPELRLCSSRDPGCAVSSIVFHIVYENLDNSPFDIVDFVVTTNDESEPEQRVSVKGLELAP
ncbi:MAG: choice-of-anchor D domain-containing protein, partial [Myxococcota bacterium]|nr:choice-of-anchor D domain-containing protein [Myxococcota bacterium]